VTRLRKMMLEELQRRNYSESTAHSYIRAVEDFARYFNRPPDQLRPEQIREYQAYLFRDRKLAANTLIQRLVALRFFFIKMLRQSWSVTETPYPKNVVRLPAILSLREVARLIDSAGAFAHRMSRARPFDPHVVAVAHLIVVVAVQLLAQKRGDIVGLDRLNRRAGPFAVERLQVSLPAKHHVGRVFGRVQAPVILGLNRRKDRAVTVCKLLQSAVQPCRLEAVGDLLRPLPVPDLDKGVVEQAIADAFAFELPRQPVVSVRVELQTKRTPGRHAQVARAEFFVDEIEVVVQTLAVFVAQAGPAARFVVPRLIARGGAPAPKIPTLTRAALRAAR